MENALGMYAGAYMPRAFFVGATLVVALVPIQGDHQGRPYHRPRTYAPEYQRVSAAK